MINLKSLDRLWEIPAGTLSPRLSKIDIFGRNPDVDTGTDPEDVWNYGGVETWLAAAAAMSISSSAAADTAIDITIDYIDTNWEAQTVTVATDGADGRTETSTGVSMLRVNKVTNASGTALAGDLYVYETSDTVTAGVPDTAAKVHGKIDIGRDASQMGKYSVPLHYDAYITDYWASINNDAGWARMAMYYRPYGGVFQVKPEFGLDEVRSKFMYIKPTLFTKLEPRTDILWKCMEVEADSTDVSAGWSLILERHAVNP